MTIEIRMPAVAPSMTEGTIVRWLKHAGEPVHKGEVLLEIETDKALVEVPATHEGVLGRIVVAEGTSGVKVDTVIALLAVNGEDVGALAVTAPSTTTKATAAPVAPQPALTTAPVVAPPVRNRTRIFASPLARRIAQSLDVDLARVTGSGPNGRVLKADVEAAARMTRPAASGPAYEDVPHTNVRRVIAARLTQAKQSVPHFYLTIDCDADALLAARRQANELVPDMRLTVNDFIVKAAALALRRVPAVNAAWTDDAIRHFRDVDVAVAVSTPGGLITPIVRNADRKSLREIASEMRELAARAREGRLRAEEFQGGGFTISNLGMHGIREFAAIINPPQACILAVGAAEQRPVVRNGALGIATLMTCTLSVDHRCVDGALGAEFLGVFKRFVEAPFALAM